MLTGLMPNHDLEFRLTSGPAATILCR